jgi:hypothetical protein
MIRPSTGIRLDLPSRSNGHSNMAPSAARRYCTQLWPVITAPELDHQIAQAEANLAQAKASRRQAKANRDLAGVTWSRDSVLVKQGWVTQQQGDTDRLNGGVFQISISTKGLLAGFLD